MKWWGQGQSASSGEERDGLRRIKRTDGKWRRSNKGSETETESNMIEKQKDAGYGEVERGDGVYIRIKTGYIFSWEDIKSKVCFDCPPPKFIFYLNLFQHDLTTVNCKHNTLYILSCFKNDKQVCKKIILRVILALGCFKKGVVGFPTSRFQMRSLYVDPPHYHHFTLFMVAIETRL